MVTPVPSLSPSGWITSPSEKADALLSHFYESDKLQSFLYQGNISNLQAIVEEFGHDVVTLIHRLQSALEVYLGRYYDAVSVNVNTDDNQGLIPSGKVGLTVYCSVTEDGKEYSFGKLIVMTDSKIDKIMKLNNTGAIKVI